MSTILNALKKAGQEEKGQPSAERPLIAERSQLLDDSAAPVGRGVAPLEALRESQKRAITRLAAGVAVGGIIVLSVLLFLIVWFWNEARNARAGLRGGPIAASMTAPPRGQTQKQASADANEPAVEDDAGAKPVARPTHSRLVSNVLAPAADTAPSASAPSASAPSASAPSASAPSASAPSASAPASADSTDKRPAAAKRAKAKSREKPVAVAQAKPHPPVAAPVAEPLQTRAAGASKKPVELNNDSLLELEPAPVPVAPQAEAAAPAAATPAPAPPVAPPQPAAVPDNASGDVDASQVAILKIGGILWSRTNPLAIVNDRMCEVGSSVGEFKVTKISKTSVEVESGSGLRRVINY